MLAWILLCYLHILLMCKCQLISARIIFIKDWRCYIHSVIPEHFTLCGFRPLYSTSNRHKINTKETKTCFCVFSDMSKAWGAFHALAPRDLLTHNSPVLNKRSYIHCKNSSHLLLYLCHKGKWGTLCQETLFISYLPTDLGSSCMRSCWTVLNILTYISPNVNYSHDQKAYETMQNRHMMGCILNHIS